MQNLSLRQLAGPEPLLRCYEFSSNSWIINLFQNFIILSSNLRLCFQLGLFQGIPKTGDRCGAEAFLPGVVFSLAGAGGRVPPHSRASLCLENRGLPGLGRSPLSPFVLRSTRLPALPVASERCVDVERGFYEVEIKRKKNEV